MNALNKKRLNAINSTFLRSLIRDLLDFWSKFCIGINATHMTQMERITPTASLVFNSGMRYSDSPKIGRKISNITDRLANLVKKENCSSIFASFILSRPH